MSHDVQVAVEDVCTLAIDFFQLVINDGISRIVSTEWLYGVVLCCLVRVSCLVQMQRLMLHRLAGMQCSLSVQNLIQLVVCSYLILDRDKQLIC